MLFEKWFWTSIFFFTVPLFYSITSFPNHECSFSFLRLMIQLNWNCYSFTWHEYHFAILAFCMVGIEQTCTTVSYAYVDFVIVLTAILCSHLHRRLFCCVLLYYSTTVDSLFLFKRSFVTLTSNSKCSVICLFLDIVRVEKSKISYKKLYFHTLNSVFFYFTKLRLNQWD